MCNACENCEHKNKFFPESLINIHPGNSLFDKNSCGLINPEIMQGIFLSVCDEANHPIVFMQKHNGNCNAKALLNSENVCREKHGHNASVCNACMQSSAFFDNYYRLESNIFYSRLSGICKFVRKEENIADYTCGFQRCLLFDSYAAAFFLDRDSLCKENRKKEEELSECHKTDEQSGREYLEYPCPVTHYTELAIPVILEKKMVGVLIFGQMLKKDDKEKHEDFFRKFSKKFENDPDFEKEKKYFDDKVYTPEEFSEKIKECIHSVKKLEAKLESLLEVYRKWYIDEISREVLEEFSKINTVSIPYQSLISTEMTEERYNEFKKALKNLSNSLCDKMSISKMICFVPDILQNAINSPEYLYSINPYKQPNSSKLVFDFNKFNAIYPDRKDKIVNQKHITEIISNLKKESFETKNLSFVLYVMLGQNQGVMPIAVLFGYNKKQLDKNRKEKFIHELDSLMLKIKDPVHVMASSIINQYMELEQRRFIQVMRHELGQSYSGYLTLLDHFEKDFFNSFSNFKHFSSPDVVLKTIEKANCVASAFIKNSRTFAHTVMLRVNGTKYSSGVQVPNKQHFYPYGQFLFKWNYIFSEVKKTRHLKFEMPVYDVYSNPDGYPLMYADPDMIEQVVFNLTNNAMKYSHFGSTITLNCRADKNKNQYILEVVNYTTPLSKEDLDCIFNYGYCGKNHNEKGSGLGLYISNEIAKRHGGSLCIEQEIISDFNVPLLQLYDENMPKNMFSEELFKNIKLEIERLKKPKENGEPSEWSLILGNPIPQNPFTPLYIKGNITKKTAKIKFSLTIPLNKNNETGVE